MINFKCLCNKNGIAVVFVVFNYWKSFFTVQVNAVKSTSTNATTSRAPDAENVTMVAIPTTAIATKDSTEKAANMS